MNLKDLFNSPSPKLAADASAQTAPTPRSTGSSNPVQDAIQAASQAARTKIASAQEPSPVEDLEKVAAQVATHKREGTIKEAQDYGAAICDGFMSRLAVYEKVAADQSARSDQDVQRAYDNTAQVVEERIHKVASLHYLGGQAMAQALVGQ